VLSAVAQQLRQEQASSVRALRTDVDVNRPRTRADITLSASSSTNRDACQVSRRICVNRIRNQCALRKRLAGREERFSKAVRPRRRPTPGAWPPALVRLPASWRQVWVLRFPRRALVASRICRAMPADRSGVGEQAPARRRAPEDSPGSSESYNTARRRVGPAATTRWLRAARAARRPRGCARPPRRPAAYAPGDLAR
jgi:hypothetical protein